MLTADAQRIKAEKAQKEKEQKKSWIKETLTKNKEQDKSE